MKKLEREIGFILYFNLQENLVKVGDGALGDVAALVRAGGRASETVRKREFEIFGVELLDVGTDAILISKSLNLDDVDALVASTVAGGHIHVELVNSANTRNVTELLVEVVFARATLVFDHDSKVADLGNFVVAVSLLSNTVDLEDLTAGLLDLGVLAQKVPEAALGADLVRSKDAHTVNARFRIAGRRQFSTDNLKFVELKRTRRLKKKEMKKRNEKKISTP